jgi:membrane fusion protein
MVFAKEGVRLTMFRSEALNASSGRFTGDVLIAVPTSWQVIGYLLGGSVIVAAIFLSLASYARIETVSGTIVPAAGVVSIIPTRSGVIAVLPIHEGQDVKAGAELASIRAEEDGVGDVTAAARIEAAIARQDASLAIQSDQTAAAAEAQLRQIAAQCEGLASEAAQLQSQIKYQRDLILSAQRDIDHVRPIAERGFISANDLRQREDNLLSRRQGLAQLMQELATKQAAIAEAKRNAVQVASQSRAQSASLAATRAEVAREAVSAASARAYVLRAPIDGRVAALTARVGQPANTQTMLMSILPARSNLRAELAVPSAAIGFVREGMEVRLALDAFPFERFGTVNGRVVTVARNTVNQQSADGTMVSTYPVTVALARSSISAFGRDEPFVSGMRLTARIVTERQSLGAWLFEPLLAVRQR